MAESFILSGEQVDRVRAAVHRARTATPDRKASKFLHVPTLDREFDQFGQIGISHSIGHNPAIRIESPPQPWAGRCGRPLTDLSDDRLSPQAMQDVAARGQ